MKEPLFRGYSKENKSWHYGFGWCLDGLTDECKQRESIEDYAVLYTESSPVKCDLESMGRHIGLKDKNDKVIYEGDILTSSEYPFQDDGKYNYHGVIEWIDEEASFYMTKRLANPEKRGISDCISQPIECIEEFEIIGNIYDNPELIMS